MARKKIISFMLIMAMVLTVWTPAFEGVAVAAPGECTLLDISKGSITIGENGASGFDSAGVAVTETALNPDGYKIVGTSTDVANNITVANNVVTTIHLENLTMTTNTSGKACLAIGEGADVDVILDNVNLTADAASAKPAIDLQYGSVVDLTIKGTNSVKSFKSAGIGLSDGVSLTINGGNRDKLTAIGTGQAAGIGNTAAKSVKNTVITINGGMITAVGGERNCPGIGGFANSRTEQIIINGGNIDASSAKGSTIVGIGYSGSASVAHEPPFVINGGSIIGGVQGTPVNSKGETLRLVEATAAGMADRVFSLLDADDIPRETVADADGKMYLYLPATATVVTATCGGETYLGEITEGTDTTPATAALKKDESDPCSCAADTAVVTFPDQDVLVYNVAGSQQVNLETTFAQAADCTYSTHKMGKVTYSLLDGVAEDVASVEGNVLTVNAAAAGQTLKVNATFIVNGKTFSKTANITVTASEDYVFDLAKGNIAIYDDEVVVGDNSYTLADTTKPVKIIQSGSGATANTIAVGSSVNKKVIIEDLNIARERVYSGADPMFVVNVNAKVELVLSGENSMMEDASNDFPAINVIPPSTLTISGDGSLYARGGDGTPGIGGRKKSAIGDIIINGGKIKALGGTSSAGIGVGVNSSAAEGNVTINGGRVFVLGGENSPRDFKASVIINGGSVATVDGTGAVSTNVRFDEADAGFSAIVPKDSTGANLYPVTLSFEDEQADKSVTYRINNDEEEGTDLQAFTDVSSKLYLYLPLNAGYQQVVATPDGSAEQYYKRIKVLVNDVASGVLSKNPTAKIISFQVSGQIGETVINHEDKTITFTMPQGVAVNNLSPTVDTDGAEYSPQGTVDFSDGKSVIYKLIADDGSEVQYTACAYQRPFAPGEKTTLNIAEGDIFMEDDGTITVGNTSIAPNQNGYIITGSSDTNFLIIDNITAPIVFRDLTMNAPAITPDMEEIYSAFTVFQNANITLEGVNTITGAAGCNAVYTAGNFVVDGEGILKLTGGTGSPAVSGEVPGAFVINGGSVFIEDKGTSNIMRPVSSVNVGTAKTLYPLIITVDDVEAANTVVKYSDTPNVSGVDAYTNKNYLADENGVISVYRPAAGYDLTVIRGENDEYKYYGKASTKNSLSAEVTVSLPKIEELIFTPPDKSLAMKLPIKLSGKNLGGEMVITATGQDGKKISATAVFDAKSGANGEWVATLELPTNQTSGLYTYTLSATADGRPQTLTGQTSFSMQDELKLTGFKLDKYQLGEEIITEDPNEKNGYVEISVPYDVDMTKTAFAPILIHTGLSYIRPGVVSFANPVTYTIYKGENRQGESRRYTVTVTPEVAPTVDSISFVEPGYTGGNVDITLNGENFDKILNAATENGSRIVVSAADREWYLTQDDVRKGINKVTVTLPSNAGGTQNKRYPITVSVNGIEQELEGNSVINVPGELEMNATINGFRFDNLPECAPELNLNQAVIDDREEGQSGTINIKVPWKTDLANLVPVVSTTNPEATYKSSSSGDFTNPVIFTVTAVKGNTKDYIVTVTRVASEAEKDPSIKSITVEEQRDSVIEQVPGENGLIPITITMPTGTDLTSVEPVIELAHPDATYEPTGPQDFSEGPQEYTVTSADGTVQKYEVTVKNAKKKKKQTTQVITSEQEVDFKAYINGYDDKTFRPNNSITRAEAAAMLARLDEDFKEDTRYSHMFEDVANDFWATDYIGYLFKGGVVKGTDGNFDADREITRMEFVAMLCRYMEMDEVSTQDIKFNDIDNVWGKDEILLAAGNGVTSGYSDGTFRPNAVITRAEAVSMLNRLLSRSPSGEVKATMEKQESPFSDLTSKHWAYAEIISAVKNYGVKTVSTTTADETTTEVVVNFK